MIYLNRALHAWGREDFQDVLRAEIEQLHHHQLPLQEALCHSSLVSDEPFQVILLGVEERSQEIGIRMQLFYSGIIAGCSCADDPTPIEPVSECCTLEVRLSKQNGEARFKLLSDEE